MYYPKSHITSNLYSNGEFAIIGSNTPYNGYYFSTIDNKFFTGRYPGDGTNEELIKFQSTPPTPPGSDVNSPTNPELAGQDIDFRFFGPDNTTYSLLNKVSPTSDIINYTPTPFYPQPSKQDYKLGEFTRYFSKKTNENKYTETSGLFENSLYIGIQLPWLITGDKDEVIRVNQNIVKLREQQLNISGLGEYLKFNYIKFYR